MRQTCVSRLPPSALNLLSPGLLQERRSRIASALLYKLGELVVPVVVGEGCERHRANVLLAFREGAGIQITAIV